MTTPSDAPRRLGGSTRTIVLALAVVGVVLVSMAYVAARDTPAAEPSGSDIPRLDARPPPTKTFALPPATLEGFDGGPPVDLTEFRGAPLVVNFWASWCAPCVKELPELRDAAAELEGEVAFVGIDVQDSPINAVPFIERLGIDYPLAIDPRRELHQELGNFGMPTTLLVDAEGIVRYRQTGPLTGEELRDLLAEYLDVPVDA
jgi:thiol-disulfide isomerase/thioredoxin